MCLSHIPSTFRVFCVVQFRAKRRLDPELAALNSCRSLCPISATSRSNCGVMPEPVAMMRLSSATEVTIRLLPGNDRCADCKAIFPQWAGVSFGILLCLTCAGKHRSLGVKTSFVKSLEMDAWSASEVRALELGGNAKWSAVCAGAGVADLSMLESDENSLLTKSCTLSAMPATKAEYLSDHVDNTTVKCTMCCIMVSLNNLNAHSKLCFVSASRTVGWRMYEQKIGAPGEPLGFTVAKASSGYAEVCRVIPGGAAERANVIVGSLLIGLNDEKNLKFNEVVGMLPTLPRPILFHFVFRSQAAFEGPKTVVLSVPEPRVVEINITLHDKEELGCSLSTTGFYCVKYLKPTDYVREICTAQRPIKITVHRVEGLMRGWSS
ncbi:unnamed protein product [Peronospora belbahrii]|uniref:Arf-GAP domain-containing protein n=1 Tax=Peronospora belbahrii TaxID=622444 RepID=A0AAU9L699_9STRA|nr:unnamed protein product [Peronospora belbahrii]